MRCCRIRYVNVLDLFVALFVALLGDLLARSLGRFLREKVSSPTSAVLDRAGGAVLGAALSLTLVWVAATFALGAPSLASLHPAMRESGVLQALNERMPSRLLTEAVARLDPLPEIRGPEPGVSTPDAAVKEDPEVLAAARRVVRVSGVACGYGIEGSGWVAARNLVVTNAHVVAGEVATRVQPGSKHLPLPAKVVVFDVKNDVAVSRVKGLGLPPL